MDNGLFRRIREGLDAQELKDRETLCIYAKTFREAILEGFGDAFTGSISEEQLQEAKTRLVELAEQTELDLPPNHFPSLGGSHLCVAYVKQELLLRLQSRLKVGLHEPIVPPPPPTIEEQTEDIVQILKERHQSDD